MFALIPHLKNVLKINMCYICCNNENNTKVSKEKTIDWIVEALDDSKVITKELVYNNLDPLGLETV